MEFHKTLEGKSYLIVKSNQLPSIIGYIKENNIKSIFINKYKGFEGSSIDFLEDCTNIENIFLVEGDYDITGMRFLKNLKSAIIGPKPRTQIDLLQFRNIKSLSLTYHENWLNLFNCVSLEDLHLWKSPYENLLVFSKLINLKSLELIQGKTLTLLGIDKLELTHFEAHKVAGLKDIAISIKLPLLQSFHLHDCKHIQNHENIQNATNLENLRYANCGMIKSISFIENMPKLKEFRFPKTLVEDGNLSYLEKIDVIMFNDTKHYSHKYKDLFLDRIKRGTMS